MTNMAAVPQPPPKPNNFPAIADFVIEDIKARDKFGTKKYGTRLQPFNGRDFMFDMYQEALDLCMYFRGALYERDSKATDGVEDLMSEGGASDDPRAA